jgi:hypothetical protein
MLPAGSILTDRAGCFFEMQRNLLLSAMQCYRMAASRTAACMVDIFSRVPRVACARAVDFWESPIADVFSRVFELLRL